MEVGGSQELANWVLSFGGGATVFEPESLRAEVRRSLEEALNNYERLEDDASSETATPK